MTVLANNFAYSTLGASINDSVTTITFFAGQGARFPTIIAPDVGYVVFQDASNNFEIMQITAHSAGSDSATVVRAREGTSARSWTLGDMVEQRPTVATVQGMVTDVLATSPALGGTPTAPTAAVETNTTQVASTAFVLAQAASATPAALGTAAAGSATRYARADHVHTDVLPATTTATTAAALTSSTLVATTAFATGADAVLCPAGVVSPYAGSSAPSGWLMCFGQAVNRTTYAVLFAITSTTYGVGDGSTTFNLPDLRGRAVAGWTTWAALRRGESQTPEQVS